MRRRRIILSLDLQSGIEKREGKEESNESVSDSLLPLLPFFPYIVKFPTKMLFVSSP